MDEINEKSLLVYDGPDRVVTSTEYWELKKNESSTVHRYNTGLPGLDTAIEGFEDGELIVVSGPTAMGKTTLCRTIMKNLYKESHQSLIFSFENHPRKIVEDAIKSNEVIFIPFENKPRDLLWLRDRCVEARLKFPFGFKAVFIDHLHYIFDMANRGNISLELGQTMRFLKQQIAIALDVPVFIVAHVGKIKFGEELSLAHIRDSSLVAQEADTVLMVCRRNDVDESGEPMKIQSLAQNLAYVKVEKSRRAGTMGAKINLVKIGNSLEECIQ